MKSEIKYKVGNKTFIYDLHSLERSYNKYINMTDEEFLKDILSALHFSIYICFVKNLETKDILSDDGIIHQLTHLTQNNTRKYVNLEEIRVNFKKTLVINKKTITFNKIIY
jgi:hypothetical protein|tara:strand:+ start:5199 stop:5531 length:333 start_codon:yes stop_codon:yes gene_type:complete